MNFSLIPCKNLRILNRNIKTFVREVSLANSDTNIPFLYNTNRGMIVADNTYCSSIKSIEDIKLPDNYIANSIMDEKGNTYNNTLQVSRYNPKTDSYVPAGWLRLDKCETAENKYKYADYDEYDIRIAKVISFFEKPYKAIKDRVQYFFTRRADHNEELEALKQARIAKKFNQNNKTTKSTVTHLPIKRTTKKVTKPVVKEETKPTMSFNELVEKATKKETLNTNFIKSEGTKKLIENASTGYKYEEYNPYSETCFSDLLRKANKKEEKVEFELTENTKNIIKNATKDYTYVDPAYNQKHHLIERLYTLKNDKALSKLGEYERAFIEDAKAECLTPEDNEFNMMLNERCVNKEAIFNYYKEVENNNIDCQKAKFVSDSQDNKADVELAFISLHEYERILVEDVIAEGLSIDDNEFNMMLNERCVDKKQVVSFMKLYRDYFVKQKDIMGKYSALCDLNSVNYSLLTINELRKAASEHKAELTESELDKFKHSKLKKAELVEILNRIDDSNKPTEELSLNFKL